MKNLYGRVITALGDFNSSPETFETVGVFTDLKLSEYSSFKIGGAADLALFPKNEAALIFCVNLLCENGILFHVIGNGSNVLFADEGVRGSVIFTSEMNDIEVSENMIVAECGAGITKISRIALENSLTGLEFACGIPGSLGGAVYMNAGAYGGQMSDVVVESTYFDPRSKKIYTISADEHRYGYRESIYIDNPDYIILSAKLRLSGADKNDIKAKMDENLRARRDKRPLEYPSAGSVFKRYPGYFTGKIIEEAGLKGYTVGGAQVSCKHAGFIINIGGATSNDVKALIDHIKKTIYSIHGIDLECEVRFIG